MNETTATAVADVAERVQAVEAALPNTFQRVILYALPRTGRHVYQGTADPKAVAKRRAANRAARKTRQAQRRAA